MYLSKSCANALNIDDFFSYLQPLSELGRVIKNSAKFFIPGDEIELENEYQKIAHLQSLLIQNKGLSEDISVYIKHIEDIRQTIIKAKEETLELYEIYEIKSFVYFYEALRNLLNSNEKIMNWNNFSDLFNYLDPENKQTPSFHISNKYSDKIMNAREEIANLSRQKKMRKAFEEQEAAKSLNVNKAEPEVVVSRYQKDLAQRMEQSGFYVLEDQNFANKMYRFKYSESILEIECNIQNNMKVLEAEEKIVRKTISQKIGKETELLETAQKEIGKLDWLLIRTIFTQKFSLKIPTILKSPICIAKETRNLPIIWDLKDKNISYQRLDLNFNKSLNIITGANMAGKTSSLKTIGQFFYFVSRGIPLPAESVEIGLVDFLYFSSATSESHRKDLSSFGAEVSSLEQAMKQEGIGVFLIDELARGTNPEEGNAFARAILEEFIGYKGLVLAATHFHKPAQIKEAAHFRIEGITKEEYYRLKTDETLSLNQRLKELHRYMNYQLKEVDPSTDLPKAALMIAEVLGINSKIINRAKELL